MNKYLPVDLVIKNVPGMGGVTGVIHIYKSKPDGYTLGIMDAEKMVGFESVRTMDYELSNFVYLGQAARSVIAYAVAANSPFYSVEDLRAASAIQPIRICEGEISPPGILPFTEMGIPFTTITGYAGSPESIAAVIAGDGEVVEFSVTSMLPWVKSGDLRPIFVLDDKPSPFFEELGLDVPTIADLGYPALAPIGSPRLIVMPPGTPDEIASVLEEVVWKSLNDPELIAWADEQDRPLNPATGEEAIGIINGLRDLYAKYKDVLEPYLG